MSFTPAKLVWAAADIVAYTRIRVMGGYVAATGVLAVTLPVTSSRDHRATAAVGAGMPAGSPSA